MNTVKVTIPTIEQVEFTIEVQQDDSQIEGNAMASGDNEADKKAENEIYEQLEGGNVWAWASVTVTAEWKGIEGFDRLGQCSYKSQEDFEGDGYYADMKAVAYAELVSKIKSFGTEEKEGSEYPSLNEFQIESMIDDGKLGELFAVASGICYEKADHIIASYDDKTLAREWRSKGKTLARIADRF